MADVLPEAFGVGDADSSASRRRPAPHRIDVLVQTVLPPQPLSLTLMAGERLGLRIDDR